MVQIWRCQLYTCESSWAGNTPFRRVWTCLNTRTECFFIRWSSSLWQCFPASLWPGYSKPFSSTISLSKSFPPPSVPPPAPLPALPGLPGPTPLHHPPPHLHPPLPAQPPWAWPGNDVYPPPDPALGPGGGWVSTLTSIDQVPLLDSIVVYTCCEWF